MNLCGIIFVAVYRCPAALLRGASLLPGTLNSLDFLIVFPRQRFLTGLRIPLLQRGIYGDSPKFQIPPTPLF
jgi:hypothetical protein